MSLPESFRSNDSYYAFGVSMMPPKLCPEIKSIDFNELAFEVLNYLNEAQGLTITAVTKLIGRNRAVTSRVLNALWYASMVKWLAVSGNNNLFKLWIPVDSKPPKSSNDACKMAVFGFYYSLAKKEVPGFSWRLIKNPKKPLLAEMTYISRDSGKLAKMIIDAPRRGEKPWPDAHMLIFPTTDEANILVPIKKRFTSDIHLIENSAKPLNKRIFEIANKN